MLPVPPMSPVGPSACHQHSASLMGCPGITSMCCHHSNCLEFHAASSHLSSAASLHRGSQRLHVLVGTGMLLLLSLGFHFPCAAEQISTLLMSSLGWGGGGVCVLLERWSVSVCHAVFGQGAHGDAGLVIENRSSLSLASPQLLTACLQFASISSLGSVLPALYV